ncbi:MAG TPA: MarR family transcriptional regulator [Aurantimonas sp.]|nr:MarR family transcriptional regulator [Aurantimonas sp.]
MTMREDLPLAVTIEVRDHCLCLHLQRAARALARRFDEALRPFGITSGQFSLLMSLNRPTPPRISDIAALLGMDRTTLTANLKPLERQGLVEGDRDPADRRSRLLRLTGAGQDVLAAALPVWREVNEAIDRLLPDTDPQQFRADLRTLS